MSLIETCFCSRLYGRMTGLVVAVNAGFASTHEILVDLCLARTSFDNLIEVQIVWEVHKNLKKSPTLLIFKFCGLLTVSEEVWHLWILRSYHWCTYFKWVLEFGGSEKRTARYIDPPGFENLTTALQSEPKFGYTFIKESM